MLNQEQFPFNKKTLPDSKNNFLGTILIFGSLIFTIILVNKMADKDRQFLYKSNL
jgi:hypothetical protein